MAGSVFVDIVELKTSMKTLNENVLELRSCMNFMNEDITALKKEFGFLSLRPNLIGRFAEANALNYIS